MECVEKMTEFKELVAMGVNLRDRRRPTLERCLAVSLRRSRGLITAYRQHIRETHAVHTR